MSAISKKKSVLIFDENHQMQDLYASLLALEKIASYFCPATLDPIAHARRLAVNGIILSLDPSLDARLPLIHKLYQNKEAKKNPLLVITAQGNPQAAKLIKKYYSGTVLLKPFSIQHFQKIIKDNFIQWWSRGESNP